MRRIVHISDLHFGDHDTAAEAAVRESLCAAMPAVVAVSGDLTQRARCAELTHARDFLAGLPFPLITVPGNHDVPFFNPFRRFFRPLSRFRRIVEANAAPSYADTELAVLGLNTARSFTVRGGRISLDQIAFIREHFGALPDALVKVLVTHHPFVLPEILRNGSGGVVGRSALALAALEQVGVHLVLSGHLHRGFAHHPSDDDPLARRSVLVIQAGTALSRRLRGEANAYNLVTIDLPRITCELHAFDGRSFDAVAAVDYELTADQWVRRESSGLWGDPRARSFGPLQSSPRSL